MHAVGFRLGVRENIILVSTTCFQSLGFGLGLRILVLKIIALVIYHTYEIEAIYTVSQKNRASVIF